MRLTDAQLEELVRRILEDTGLAHHQLTAIVEGMVATYGIRERYARNHNEESDRKYDNWDFYLSGSYEVLLQAGAHMQHIEALVVERYWRKMEAETNA